MPAPAAADVGPKFDCLIDGQGYLFADPQDIKAEFGFTPTFITRQNTQGDYGDTQQDFFLTYTQRDWSLGEQQKFQGRDNDGKRRYWRGTSLNVVNNPGSVSLRKIARTVTPSGTIVALGPWISSVIASTSTNIYEIQDAGSSSSKGAHGLGVAPSTITTDSDFAYISAGNVGKVRKFSAAGAFSDFSTSGSDRLLYLNNSLYGLAFTSGSLIRYDTAGAVTTLFTWKDATGTAGVNAEFVAFGGKIAILRTDIGQLFLYDGVGVSIIYQLPPNCDSYAMTVSQGTIFISGSHSDSGRAVIYYYANGTSGLLWESDTPRTDGRQGTLAAWRNGLIFTDPGTSTFMVYDAALGGVSTVASYTGDPVNTVVSRNLAVQMVDTSSSVYTYSDDATNNTTVTSGTLTTSLADFDSSLNKLFRGIKVDFDSATDGNGGSIDIAYRVGDVDGSYTTLQTGAVSGTEYTLSGVSGRSLSVKLTINKGTSTLGPILKRIFVRGAPVQTKFKTATYILRLEGIRGRGPYENHVMQLRNGQPHNKDAAQMITDLRTAASSTSTISITDEANGTFTGVIDGDGFKIQKSFAGGYWVTVPVREV